MPSRIAVHHATATSPHLSNNAVNDIFSAFSRKLTSQHIEQIPPPSPSQSRRSSFKMDHILHPGKKEKKKHSRPNSRATSPQREAAKPEKRSSLVMPHTKSKDKITAQAQRLIPSPPAKFEMIMESPPAIFIGSPAQSSGALLSGRLKLVITDSTGEVTLTNFTGSFKATTTTKKPVSKECKQCTEKQEDLKTWNFLSEPKTFVKTRDNQFPWSFLIPGKVPASTQCHLGSIAYAFVAHATTASGENIEFSHPIEIRRAIPSGPDKSSIRIFPPTNLTGRVQLPPVIHPIGQFPVKLMLSGVVEKKHESQTRWRLRKMMWRVEEHSKIISCPCEKHKNKVSEGKAIQHTESKTLGNDEMKTGWKSDFDTAGGEISMEFDASIATKPQHKPTCDVDSAMGLEVKHNLVVELIVAEEFCPNKNTNLITPTGAARVLRMQFGLLVTDRAGMGISWDEEMPPMYEDVPASPPGYGSADKNDGAFGGAIMEDYNGPELQAYDLVRVRTENPTDPPIYRERDMNDGLPMRSRHSSSGSSELPVPGQSRGRISGFRLDDLEAEPMYRPRRESADDNTAPEEDYGVGDSGAAP